MSEKDLHTKREINGQPELWREVFALLQDKRQALNSFLKPLLAKENLQIVLSGAGSSAFVGEAAQGLVQKNSGANTKAIATTDIVTHPQLSLQRHTPTLLVSFARSGNSPESLETVKLADSYCEEVYHLMITCNKEGELLGYVKAHPEKSYGLLLPEASNDQSLAMTGSFTSMLLAVILVFSPEKDAYAKEVSQIIAQGEKILAQTEALRQVVSQDIERVVFLGSGPMLGIARECHLKLQELTDGQLICKFDSFLGFRHGPRAVTNQKTLLVYLFSQDAQVYRYERDLVESLSQDPRNLPSISLGRPTEASFQTSLNIPLDLQPGQELNIIPAALVGQLLGYLKSLELGLNPDNPSVSGSISRVVQGVNIYPNPNL